jgi:hypothetical protein
MPPKPALNEAGLQPWKGGALFLLQVRIGRSEGGRRRREGSRRGCARVRVGGKEVEGWLVGISTKPHQPPPELRNKRTAAAVTT